MLRIVAIVSIFRRGGEEEAAEAGVVGTIGTIHSIEARENVMDARVHPVSS